MNDNVQSALSAKQIEENPLQDTIEAIQKHVDAYAIAYPELGLSFGYIGNVYRDGTDDRNWSVFTNRRNPNTLYGATWGRFDTHRLPLMVLAIEKGQLVGFCQSALTWGRAWS